MCRWNRSGNSISFDSLRVLIWNHCAEWRNNARTSAARWWLVIVYWNYNPLNFWFTNDIIGPGLKPTIESIDNRLDFKTYMQNYAYAHGGQSRGPRRDGPREEGFVSTVAPTLRCCNWMVHCPSFHLYPPMRIGFTRIRMQTSLRFLGTPRTPTDMGNNNHSTKVMLPLV